VTSVLADGVSYVVWKVELNRDSGVEDSIAAKLSADTEVVPEKYTEVDTTTLPAEIELRTTMQELQPRADCRSDEYRARKSASYDMSLNDEMSRFGKARV